VEVEVVKSAVKSVVLSETCLQRKLPCGILWSGAVRPVPDHFRQQWVCKHATGRTAPSGRA